MTYIKKIFFPTEINLKNGKTIQPPIHILPYVCLIIILFAYISIYITGFKLSTIIKRGDQFFVILREMFPPSWEYIQQVKNPLLDTIKMSLLGSIVGAFLAIPLSIISSTNMNSSKISLNFTRIILSIIRTVPTLIIALIATYIFDIGNFAGSLAIGIFTLGIVSKMLYEQIETVDMKAFEAMESLGATKTQAFIGGIVPQILPSYLSIVLYSFEINVRYAAILGYVGAGGIGLLLDENIGWREYDRVGMVIAMLFITVLIIESLSRYIRRRLI